MVVNNNPTNCSTTLCTYHTNFGALLVRHVTTNNRVALANSVSGCPNFGRKVSNFALNVRVRRRTRHFNTGARFSRILSISFSRGVGAIGACSNRLSTGTIVVTDNTGPGRLNLRGRASLVNHKLRCYTRYSKHFCESGAITIVNNNGSTMSSTLCLSHVTGGICLVRQHSALETAGVCRRPLGGTSGIRFL